MACDIFYARARNPALLAVLSGMLIVPCHRAVPEGSVSFSSICNFHIITEMQAMIHVQVPGIRKVVVASNIAETSITVDDIRYVIDSGFVRKKVYQLKTGKDLLALYPNDQASARRRAARAGRTGRGTQHAPADC